MKTPEACTLWSPGGRTSGLGQPGSRTPSGGPEKQDPRHGRDMRTGGLAHLGVCRIGWVRQGKAKQGLLTPRYAVTLEEAKAQFQKSWDAWKAWAKLEEAP